MVDIVNDKSILKITAPAKGNKPHKVIGSVGLFLNVTAPTTKDPKGRFVWLYRYKNNDGKDKKISIGEYPAISLAQAKDKQKEYHALRIQNIDPQTYLQEQAEKSKKDRQNRFTPLFLEWASTQKWSDNTRKKREYRIQLLTDHFKDRPLHTITQSEIIDLLQLIEKTHRKRTNPNEPSEVATRCKGLLIDFFGWAGVREFFTDNPTANIQQAKSEYILKSVKYGKRPALVKPKEFGAMLADLERCKETVTLNTYHNVMLLAYLCVRNGDIRRMKWADIHWDDQYWELEPIKGKSESGIKMVEKMKVPLSQQVINILQKQRTITGDYEYVFYSETAKTNGIISENTAGDYLNELGYKGKHCTHGFRASGKSLLMQELDYNHVITEMVLGHMVNTGHKGEDPYMRADLYDQRCQLMQLWADYIDDLKAGKDVTKYRGIYRQSPNQIVQALLGMIGKDELVKLINADRSF